MANTRLSYDVLGILSLVIGFLALFFSENKVLSLSILFIAVITFFGYNYYKENQSKLGSKDKKVKTQYFSLIAYKVVWILILAYSFYVFLAVIFFPEKFIALAITFVLLALLLRSIFSKPLKLSEKPLKSHKEFFCSIIFIMLLSALFWFLSLSIDLKYFTILSYLIYTWSFFAIIVMLNIIQFILAWDYNKNLFSKRTKKSKFNWKNFVSTTFFIILLITMTFFMIILPQAHTPQIFYLDSCHSQYVYGIDSLNKVLNSYMYSLPIKEFSSLNVTLSGIFEKGGEYQEISILEINPLGVNYSDKKYLQYFEVYPFYDKSIDILVLRFYIKRMELLDSLKIIGIKDNC